jgi:hypothetical protein
MTSSVSIDAVPLDPEHEGGRAIVARRGAAATTSSPLAPTLSSRSVTASVVLLVKNKGAPVLVPVK